MQDNAGMNYRVNVQDNAGIYQQKLILRSNCRIMQEKI